MPPKCIFFDLDETLVENKRTVPELFVDVYADQAEILGSENQERFFTTLREHAGGLWESMFDSNDSPESLFADCFIQSVAALGFDSGESTDLGNAMINRYQQLSAANVQLYDDAISTINQLREQGFQVGIITNGIEKIQQGKIDAVKLEDHVNHVTISAQARAHKPHAPVFELALSRANCGPSEAWQVGDHATNDVAGAIRMGMKGVFYDPNGNRRATAFDELEVEPSHTIARLSKVLELTQN
ncbi:MAG: HAD family hydrolase [Pseudomonadota bacterium]